MLRLCRFGLLLSAALCVAAFPYLVTAEADPVKPGADRQGPLPSYFGKIAVSDEQRVQLYKIQNDYEARIDELQRQVKALIQERDSKMEELLTPGQKLRLAELKAEAKARAAKPDEAPATPPTKQP